MTMFQVCVQTWLVSCHSQTKHLAQRFVQLGRQRQASVQGKQGRDESLHPRLPTITAAAYSVIAGNADGSHLVPTATNGGTVIP